jgi:hypothetical protein
MKRILASLTFVSATKSTIAVAAPMQLIDQFRSRRDLSRKRAAAVTPDAVRGGGRVRMPPSPEF